MSLLHTSRLPTLRPSALRQQSLQKLIIARPQLHVCNVASYPNKGQLNDDEHEDENTRRNLGKEGAANGNGRAKSNRGASFSNQNRRRGRPAHLRSPDDSPLRDGNRDRLIGLLTDRAAKTLLVYMQEMNPTVYHWLFCYIKENPIPIQGSWDEISGEEFLRTLLSMNERTTKMDLGRSALFDNVAEIGIDPRQLAQRIMEIRVQLSKEFVQDLQGIQEENSLLLRETLQASLEATPEKEPVRQLAPRAQAKVFVHPELLDQSGALIPEVAESHPELVRAIKRLKESESESSGDDSSTPSDGDEDDDHDPLKFTVGPLGVV